LYFQIATDKEVMEMDEAAKSEFQILGKHLGIKI